MNFIKVTLLTLSFGLLQYSYAAKPFVVKAKCPVLITDKSLAPKNVPNFIYGEATDRNKSKACTAAKRNAIHKFPEGTKPKHCRCL